MYGVDRADVVKHRNEVFLPAMEEVERRGHYWVPQAWLEDVEHWPSVEPYRAWVDAGKPEVYMTTRLAAARIRTAKSGTSATQSSRTTCHAPRVCATTSRTTQRLKKPLAAARSRQSTLLQRWSKSMDRA